jgi:hypothetical protein
MRKFFTIAFVLVAMLAFATSGFALERSLDRATNDVSGDWNAGSTCTIQYWNGGVGWTWTWTGWSPGDRIGVNYQACGAALTSVDIFTRFTNNVPVLPGYGFTATLDAFAADGSGCPTGPSLGSTTFLPNGTIQNVAFAAAVPVPTSFVASVTMGSGGGGTTRYGSDFDATGPTGPQGCGTCFPTTRVSNSYYYGTATTPLCPGSKLSVICEVEWRWNAHMSGPISVENSSWGQIKDLYR